MNKDDVNLLKKIEKIRGLLDQINDKTKSAERASKQTYDYVRERLILDSGQCVHIQKALLFLQK